MKRRIVIQDEEGNETTVYCLSDEAFDFHFFKYNVIEIEGAA